VVAIDRRRPRDGRALEILGYYDPLTEPATVRLETEKIKAWIGKGAQPSEMVSRLLRQVEAAPAPTAEKPKKPASKGRTTRKPKAAAASAPAASGSDEATSAGADDGSEAVDDTAAAGAVDDAAAAADETPAAEGDEAATRDDA
jgi:small subunit ribosomal protein S16